MAATSSAVTTFTKDPAKTEYIYVNGDSNSQGLLKPISAWNLKIGMGRMTPKPWPVAMEKWLQENGISVIVENYSETGRRLIGKSPSAAERSSVGSKDGRVALQQMIGTIFNKHDIISDKVHIIINLGTNDLQDHHISKDYLKGSLIKHVLTVLINPNFQYSLWDLIKDTEKEPKVSDFFERLNKILSEDISKSYSETTPLTQIEKFSGEMASHGEIFNKFIYEHISVIRDLFSRTGWNFVIVPPVLITGRPFGAFVSADLSRQWPEIVNEVVEFFAVKNIYAVKEAQKFCTPDCDEFGGSLHLTPEQHFDYGLKMAQFFLLNQKKLYLEKMQSFLTGMVGINFEPSAVGTEINKGMLPTRLLPAFEATKKKQLTAAGIIKEIAEYAMDLTDVSGDGRLKF